jgi:putative membrane protein insertion efficiency factor
MGHSHSPARLGGADRIFSADGRTPQPGAERARVNLVSSENRPGIIARALLVLLRAYQVYLSPMNFSACRFHPSCSHYAGEAVRRFGARRGVWLAMKRLARCQPFSKGGFDPVPDLLNSSRSDGHQTEGVYQGTASAVPYRALTSGALAPAKIRATRGQELAQ